MSADWWQNLANNFAADLAPLISLFGELPTKQYLSETLTFIDVFIFSMAPIGVLTALVSAIRVAGSRSIRAFIGRAQEGPGLAEAEICSSTSRNVCELYTNGGIVRVFGRPKILEFVHDWEPNTPPDQLETSSDEAGIYLFKEYLSTGNWRDKKSTASLRRRSDAENCSTPIDSRTVHATRPNLSLNVGIQKLHQAWFYLVAILGFVLQSGVVAFAALITYEYPTEFKTADNQTAVPAFPFVCTGTVLLCFGVGMCASIVERSTYERTFKRKEDQSRLYWIQPGDQIFGDQVFDCFAYSDAKHQIKEYTTSQRDRRDYNEKYLPKQAMFVWGATFMTVVGFILQFLGLRALHSTVSAAQFGAMLTMTIARSLLRAKRFKAHNLLGHSSKLYLYHELDWLAMEMAQENHNYFAQGALNRTRVPYWNVIGPSEATPIPLPPQHVISGGSNDKATKAYVKRVKLAQMTGAPTLARSLATDDPWDDAMIASRTWASKLACAIEGVMNIINLRCNMKDTLRDAHFSWSLRCWMRTEADPNPPKSTVPLIIHHEVDGYSNWKTDRARLEGVLGLWLWSVVLVERLGQLDDKISAGDSLQQSSRLIYVLGDSKFPDAEASLNLWLGNRRKSLLKAKLTPVDTTFHPGNWWVESKPGHLRELASHTPRDDYAMIRTSRRIFGSNVVPTTITAQNERKPLDVLHMKSASSLEMMCAQELFTIFFNAVVAEIDEIGGDTEIVKGALWFYVANSTLSEMIENFASSGIGDHDDAIACMVPVLCSAKKLSYSMAFMTVRVVGEEYRQREQWTKAERVLLPALELALQDFASNAPISLPSDTERTSEIFCCLLCLCELYRGALLGDKRARLFGLRGFVSLYNLWENHGRIPSDLDVYRHVALEMSKEEQSSREIKHAFDQLKKKPSQSSFELVEDFHDALYQRNLAGTLRALRPSILDSCTGRPILALAAKNGWYPVMKSLQGLKLDSMDVDHNGLNYLHYAAQSCNATILKDLIGDDMDLLRHVDDFGRTPLHLAAAAGRADVVLVLTQHFSVEVNIKDNFSRSPLDNAILSDQVDTFAILAKLEKDGGAEPPPGSDWDLETQMLFQAACCGSVHVVLRLMTGITDSNSVEKLRPAKDDLLRCQIDLKNNEDISPEKFIQIHDLLSTNGYDLEKWRIEGRTGLSFAAEADRADLITCLLTKSTKKLIIGIDNEGKTCLHHAVTSEAESAVEALIESSYASNLLVKDKYGLDPMEYALRNKSFSIASILLKKDPRRQQFILPGTAIATGRNSICFQSPDSQIRKLSLPSHGATAHPYSSLPISAKLYTPLAIIGGEDEDHIFYVSKENTIGHLRSFHEGERFEMGVLQQKAIKVDAKSSLAALDLSEYYLYYQDGQNWIREITLTQRGDIVHSHRPTIALASRGSDLIARAGDKKDGEMDSSRCVYFQNRYYEIEKAFIKHDGKGNNKNMAVLTPLLRFSPDLSAIRRSWMDPLLPWYSKDGRIYVYGVHGKPHKPLIMRDAGSSPTRFAVNSDPYPQALYYQSNLGGIMKVEIAELDSPDCVLLEQVQVSVASAGEIHDNDSPTRYSLVSRSSFHS